MAELTYAESLEYFAVKEFKGNRNLINEKFREKIKRCVELINENSTVKSAIKSFAIEKSQTGVNILGTFLSLKGNDISRHLDSCGKVHIFLVTLGHSIDLLIKKFQINDIAASYYIDTLAGYYIEKCCNEINQDIKMRAKYPITERYSCGYGDFPLDTQKDILTLLDAEKTCGAVLTEGGMIIPFKTVTAIIGEGAERKIDRCGKCLKKSSCKGECLD